MIGHLTSQTTSQMTSHLIKTHFAYPGKIACLFLEAHQCVFSDFSPFKIGQNFACFQKKVKGFTFMKNLLTSKLKTGALCVAFARVKIYHLGLPTG